MRLPDDFEEESPGGQNNTLVYALAIAVTSVIVIGLVVLASNGFFEKKRDNSKLFEDDNTQVVVNEKPVTQQSDLPEDKLKPSDLDFWDMYTEEEETEVSQNKEPEEDITEKVEEEGEDDPATDGKHTLVELPDGTTEWLLINPYLDKNEYDYTNLRNENGIMKYMQDGKETSYFGVDISKEQGYVDFNELKKAGVDYVMIRVGARGYGNGQLVEDDYFQDNMKRAGDAGLKLGVYFFSQAVTVEEAIEEADYVLEKIQGYQVTYPVAFYMEYVANDTARVEELSRDEKTDIAIAFLDHIKEAGYKTAIFADKEWILKQLDHTILADYDLWLAQAKELPDYPYRFTMWQYSTTSSIEGIAGNVNLNMSFIDYSEK